ncbi:hypothetical protein [Myxococcus phage Mx1]|nr:hypothetical protein [Myxococcus phage Mx1]
MNSTGTKWEYMIWTPKEGRLEEANLDKVGAQGWELVSVSNQPFSGPEYIFKRPLRSGES